MAYQSVMTAWAGATLAAVILACAGAQRQAAESQEAAVPAPSSTTASAGNVVTQIEPANVVNRAPRFISVAPRMAQEGEPYQYGFSAWDPDGDEVTYTLLRAPEGASLQGQVLKWTPRHGQAGRSQRFTLRAVDERGAAQEQTWSVIPKVEPGACNMTGPSPHR